MLARSRHTTRVSEYWWLTVAEYNVRRTALSQRVFPHVTEILAIALDEDALLLRERVVLVIDTDDRDFMRTVSRLRTEWISVKHNRFKHREPFRAYCLLERLEHTLMTVLLHHVRSVGVYRSQRHTFECGRSLRRLRGDLRLHCSWEYGSLLLSIKPTRFTYGRRNLSRCTPCLCR